MRTQLLILLSLAALLLSGCGTPTEQSSSTTTTPDDGFPDITATGYGVDLLLEPTFGDMTTNVGDGAIRIWLGTTMRPVSAEVFDALSKGVKIYKANGSIVPFTVKTYSPPKEVVDTGCEKPCTPKTTPKTTGPKRPYIELIPTSPLTDAWHELAFATLPKGWGHKSAQWLALKPSYGANGIRFHPKSHPVPTILDLCKKSAGFWVASLLYSEDLDPSAATKLTMAGAGSACEYGYGAGTSTLTFKCLKGAPGAWALNFAPGIQSKTGKPAMLWPNKASPATVTIQMPALKGTDKCVRYRW